MYLIMTAPAWMRLNLQSKATKNPESVFLHLSQIIPLRSPHPHVLHGIYTLLFVPILSENKICSLKCPGWSVLPHCNQTEVVSFFLRFENTIKSFWSVWFHSSWMLCEAEGVMMMDSWRLCLQMFSYFLLCLYYFILFIFTFCFALLKATFIIFHF